LDDIEPGIWDLMLDTKILSDASEKMNPEHRGSLQDDIERKYKRMEMLDPLGGNREET
jgi:hypothetical protein